MQSHFADLSRATNPVRRTRVWSALAAAWLTAASILALPSGAWAKTKEKVLYSFPNQNGDHPTTSILTIDKQGDLYGVAASAVDNGVVFKLTHADHKWTESVVYSFKGGNDGADPQGGLAFDKAGNLYGVTFNGGRGKGCSGGCGTVFELTPSAYGGWTENVLYTFAGGTDGANPEAALAFDNRGRLYGTTTAGGDASCEQGGCGTVFELAPGTGGQWTESVLHRFAGGKDGSVGFGGVVVGRSGNVYGTTSFGGTYSSGIVFALALGKGGKWKETVLHSFKGGRDGALPAAGLALFGNALYGTTYAGGEMCEGGNITCGTVFQVERGAGGKWTEAVIHRFHGTDGIESFATPVLDRAGNLYGTTFEGGSGRCGVCGTAFKLTPSANGRWKETVLHDFGGEPDDAGTPEAGVILNKAGHLFGTSSLGGTSNGGTVYEITP